VPTATVYDALLEGLSDGWLLLEDLGPDLAGVQIWVELAQPCDHPDDAVCRGVAVHEFVADGSASAWAPCRPDSPSAATTTAIRGVRVLWGDGRADQLSAVQATYLAPIVERHRPRP
jgi:hypothetical protein